jgi:HD-like signal output (HDOD) protein
MMSTSVTGTVTQTSVDPQQMVAQAIKKVSSIGTLPEVTAQIIMTVENPKSTAAQLHKIVAHDPALVTRILKVVNSSFYGLPGQIASVERAIVMLGLNAIKNIAVAASLGQMFRGVQLCEGFTAKDLWKHCVAVGVAARELAKQTRLPIGDEAFLAGMIHDVGMLVILQSNPEQLKLICTRAQQEGGTKDFCSIERDVTGGIDHQMLGAALAEQWKFPRPCVLVAGYHHRPAQLTDGNRQLVHLVHIADTMCCQAGQGFNLTAVHQSLDEESVRELKLEMVTVDRVRAALPDLLGQVSSLVEA